MKSKKLSKLIKKSMYSSFKKIRSNDANPKEESAIENTFNDYLFTECGDDIKKKSRNLIFRLIELRDEMNMHINENKVSISSDFPTKKSKSHVNNSSLSSAKITYTYFNIEIIKNIGYILSFSEKRLAFKDESLYDELIGEIKSRFESLNIRNFNELYVDILKEAGLTRESNLDDLLAN